ncbi:YkgJ family cysteine cluster protein [Desulfothermus naphthae]
MENKVFKCQMCGECCKGEGGIIVTLKEIQRMAKYLSLTPSDFMDKFICKTPDGKLSLAVKKDGRCVFFDTEKKGCTVHPVKPDICLAWPFFKGNLEDEYSFLMAKEYCPGILRHTKFDEFKKYGYFFLKKHNLIKDEENGPNALKISVSGQSEWTTDHF